MLNTVIVFFFFNGPKSPLPHPAPPNCESTPFINCDPFKMALSYSFERQGEGG